MRNVFIIISILAVIVLGIVGNVDPSVPSSLKLSNVETTDDGFESHGYFAD